MIASSLRSADAHRVHSLADSDIGDHSALIGRTLGGRYRVTGLLGEGGIGRVYRAEHVALKRPVALKILLEHYQAIPDLQKRFEREAMALSALSHPNIVTITDFDREGTLSFLVMELVEGDELSDVMAREEKLPLRLRWSIIEQLLSSLAYAHERDVIHRDLKPENVILRHMPAGRIHVEVLDFGLAKFMDGTGPGAGLTKSGLIIGTPAYMAPEQASGGRADRRSDLYSTGILIFELLSGEHPFGNATGPDLFRHHLLTPPPTLRSCCPSAEVHPELESFLARALEKNGAQRWPDGAAMLEAFLALPNEAFASGDSGHRSVAPAGYRTTVAVGRAADLEEEPSRKASSGSRPRWSLIAGGLAATVVFAGLAGYASVTSTPSDGGEASESIDPDMNIAAEHENVPDSEYRAAEAASAEVDVEEADIEETEVDEPLPEASAQVPAVDPWAERNVPRPIATIRRRLQNHRSVSSGQLRRVISYRSRHPSDARASLILGHLYMSRRWLSDTLSQYERAHRRDPSSRGDSQMMGDIIEMAATEALHERATLALLNIYGEEARDALTVAMASRSEEAEGDRLESALNRIDAMP